MRRILANLGLVAGSVVAALLLSEIVLRVVGFSAPEWYQPDPVLGWGFRPGVEGWFTTEGRAYVRANSTGWRDREHSIEKPKDTYRIAVLGDSYVEARQVDIKDTFWSLLEGGLNDCAFQPRKKIEVMGLGVSGFGTAQEYLVLESAALRYRPDLVLLAFTNGNDVANNSKSLEPEKARPFFVVDSAGGLQLDTSFVESPGHRRRSSLLFGLARELSDYSRVLQLVHFARSSLAAQGAAAGDRGAEAGLDYSTFAPPRDSRWDDAWIVTERIIAKMAELVSRAGSSFAIVSVTNAIQVHPDPQVRERLQRDLDVPDLFYVERRLQRLGDGLGVPVVPLAYEMQRQAEVRKVFFHGFPNVGMGIGHWNEKGHRMAADLIAHSLCGGKR
jgi:hypothetical protein